MNRGTGRQTLSELRELQRLAGAIIMRPLSRRWRMQGQWTDQRDMRAVAAEFIKPNDRLTSFERIEIYNRQYWFRLIDSFHEDFPGLRAVLGRLKFNNLTKQYLTNHPSRSFSLRNLGRNLAQFVKDHPKLTAPRSELACEMARFEWAQVEAFDGQARPPVTVDDLLGKNPAKLRLALQPYISVLQLEYPLDEYMMRLKKSGLRGDASNAMEERMHETRPKRRSPIPRRRRVFVVVHRHDNSLYYKRIDESAFRLLTSLRKGDPLGKAIKSAFAGRPDPEQVRERFETWTELGWFCKPR
jgi:Putative DNA-binding domain